jgi:uncharacterized protein (DUF2141 family)
MKKNVIANLANTLNIKVLLPAIVAVITFMSFVPVSENPKLIVQINKVQKTGTVYVSVCTKSAEWSDNGKYTFKYEPTVGVQNELVINSIPNGDYAIAIYQDQNGNGKLDTNFFGIPKEPYAFSNNKVPVFSEPSFEKCKFQFTKQTQQIIINLLN